jgi:branched-chain amino acid transport system substrate-binding protein
MVELPTGTVTFLFTDIEGSTQLVKQLGRRYETVLADHQRILRECFNAHNGREIDTQGDSFFVAFARAGDAVTSAAEAQRALAAHSWPDGVEVRVRMGLHTGEPRPTGERYVGFGVHRAARIGAVGHGGQVLLSNTTRELVEDELPPDTRIAELGAFELKDLDRPERLFQLEIEGLPSQFPPLRAPKVAQPRHVRRRTVLLSVLGGLVVSAAAASAFAFWPGGSQGGSVTGDSSAGRILAIDASTGAIDRLIPAARTPSAIAAGEGAVWLVDADARTLIRIDEASGEVETLSTGATPTDVAVGPGAVWVGNGERLEIAQFIGPVATGVARLDPATRTERANVPLPYEEGDLSNLVENHLAATEDALWAVTPDFAVVRIERATAAVTASTNAVPAVAVAAGGAGVWVLGADGSVVRLDERTARPVARARIPVPVTSIGVGEDAAWVTSGADGSLWRVAGGSDPALGTISLAPGAADVAVGGGAVWVVNPLAGTLSRIDLETATVARTIEVEGIPVSVAVDGETVWVAVVAGPGEAVTKEVAGVEPLPARICEPVLAGADESALLVVSDLPLQGGHHLSSTQMAQAIAFVLRERRFRAGRFSVAYQSCDDSIASTGLFDEAKCGANAQAYAQNSQVVGVIGTLNSPCALAALPGLNSAPDGPLGMVSPLNSFVGLTRAGPGVHPSLPAALYPTGRRNYVRVYPTDDLQGAALALHARDRGRKRVFVLDDGDVNYGALMATGFETAARRLGLAVAGRMSWDPGARRYTDIADRVARSGAKAVFIGGLLDSNAAQVVRDLRARLDRSVDLLGPDGLTPLPLLVERAGDAALGVYVSVGGIVIERLPPAGERFVERFGRTQAGATIEPSAVYAAQATQVLLDAIARSDGTRASVVDELFRTRVDDGLLGSFAFDRNGDITESPITIVRVRGPGSSTTVGSVDGGVVERVVRPQSRLVR